MILTNALLSIGFSLVSNFSSVVAIPADSVPKTIEELREYFVGDPHCPLDLYLTARCGTMFAIRDGAVCMFESPDSYWHLQNPELLPRFLGRPTLDTNEVVEVATRAVQRLVTNTNPIANIHPVLQPAGTNFQGKEIPFYEVIWRKSDHRPGFGYFALVEIDARDGRIVSLELHDPGFSNFDLVHSIAKNVNVPDQQKLISPSTNRNAGAQTRIFPLPTTEEIEEGIRSWCWLGQLLGIQLGTNKTLAAINWDRTCLFTNNPIISSTDRLCRVEFKDGAWILSLKGVTIAHHAGDSYFTGDWQARTEQERQSFRGKINHRWQDLAESFRLALIAKLSVPAKYLIPYAPHPSFEPAELGSDASNKRVLVLWTYPKDWRHQGFGVEFDAETGELKVIGFNDPKIIEALARAQGKSFNSGTH